MGIPKENPPIIANARIMKFLRPLLSSDTCSHVQSSQTLKPLSYINNWICFPGLICTCHNILVHVLCSSVKSREQRYHVPWYVVQNRRNMTPNWFRPTFSLNIWCILIQILCVYYCWKMNSILQNWKKTKIYSRCKHKEIWICVKINCGLI